jgi:hypothetical protein
MSAMVSRKDFNEIAQTINLLDNQADKEFATKRIGAYFKSRNPRFDMDRWNRACLEGKFRRMQA